MVRFMAEEFGVASGDIERVLSRMNVNKQLRIKSLKRLPAVSAQQGISEVHFPQPRQAGRRCSVQR